MPRSLTNHIDSPLSVGLRLKRAREEAGLSQRQLAFTGCTAAYISRIESGARIPSLQMLHELALRLGITRDWLAMGYVPNGDVALAERLAQVEHENRILHRRLDEIAKLATP